jgi:predicted dehydrogenase
VPAERFRKWVEATNIFQYLGVHYVDIIYFATGAKPLRAMALGQKGWLYSKGIDTYDSIEGTIEWEMPDKGRFTSCILTNWIDPESTSAMSDQKIKVIGTKGRFESDQKRRGVTIVSDEKGIKEPNPYFCAAYNAPGQVSYRGYGIESIHQFLKDVEEIEMGVVKIDDLEGERPTFKESIVPTAVIEAVNKSLKDGGQWVSIHEVSK